MNQAENMNFNNIFLDNIAKPSVFARQKENVSNSYMSLIRYVKFKKRKVTYCQDRKGYFKDLRWNEPATFKAQLLTKIKKEVSFESKVQSNKNIISLMPCVHQNQQVLPLF